MEATKRVKSVTSFRVVGEHWGNKPIAPNDSFLKSLINSALNSGLTFPGYDKENRAD